MTERIDGRRPDQLRPVTITTNVLDYAEGSCIIEAGRTRVLCAASVEEKQPGFLRGTQSGWVTAEYAMLPRATHTRSQREVERGRPGGRTQEIQRLVGRSLRGVVNMELLGPRTITVSDAVIMSQVGAVSVGIIKGVPMLDLCYEEDSTADVDFNVVMTGDDAFIEVQGTAEHRPFSRSQMDALLDLAREGITELFAGQREALAG